MLAAAACPNCPTLLTAVDPADLACPACATPMVAATSGPDGPEHGGVAYELDLGAAGRVVGLRGEVDLAAADAVGAALDRAAGARTLVVDLAAVRFADSTALSLLLGVHRRLADDEALVTVAPPAEARVVFRIAGVERVLGVRETRRDAMAELHRRHAGR